MIATVGLAVFTGLHRPVLPGPRGLLRHRRLHRGHPHLLLRLQLLPGPGGGRLRRRRWWALIIGYPTLKAKLRTDYFAIATLGFGEAIRVLLENLPITQGARGLPGIRGDTTLPVLLVAAALVIWAAWNLIHSRHGRACIAIREDFVAAEMMGVNIFIGRLRSLVFSAFCAGLAGGLFAHYFCFIQPSMFTATMSTQMTATVVAGGMGSISGPVIADADLHRHPGGAPGGQHLAPGGLRAAAGAHHDLPPAGPDGLPGAVPGHDQGLVPARPGRDGGA